MQHVADTRLAQTYPTGPVRVVVPFPAGGGNDSMGRILAQKLTESLGKQFIVENRGGANGMVGSELVAQSAEGRLHADGERRELRHHAEPVREADLRPDPAVRADQPDRVRAERARRASVGARAQREGADRARESAAEARSTSRARAAAARRISPASSSRR